MPIKTSESEMIFFEIPLSFVDGLLVIIIFVCRFTGLVQSEAAL